MSTAAIDFATLDGEQLESQGDSILRSAFYVKGHGQPVFGWLHQPSERETIDHGVIICPPIGYEQLHSHRSLRYLADCLARESIPTLRFDWHGTGDSPGNDEDPHRVSTWLHNIRDASEWMRTHLGCRKVSLIGLRLGATLAALASADNRIDHLVLWSPVTKGRAYVREMKAISLTSETPIQKPKAPSDDIEAAGFSLTAETANALSAIDLLQIHPNCQRILVVSRVKHSEDERLCNQWATAGIHVQQTAAPGFAEMMVEPHRSQVPHRAIQQIADWVRNAVGVDSQRFATNELLTHETSVSVPTRTVESNCSEPRDTIRESTFQISNHPELFGIVSEPTTRGVDLRPTILLLNAGSAHRVAPSRINVLIARRLAAEGFRSVRMDLNGLGDSVTDVVENENDSYPATAFRDIDLTIKQIEQRFGARQIVLMGLCSGAYAAFQSAAQIPNPALVESILLNPLTYFWKEGMTLEASPTKQLMSFHYYQQVAFKPQKWLKLFSGKSKIGIAGAVNVLARRLGFFQTMSMTNGSPMSDLRRVTGLSHPQKEDLIGDLDRIASRDRNLAMFFSRTDPGFSILNHHARRKATELQAAGRLKVTFIEDADHTFTRCTARTDLLQAISNHFRDRYS